MLYDGGDCVTDLAGCVARGAQQARPASPEPQTPTRCQLTRRFTHPHPEILTPAAVIGRSRLEMQLLHPADISSVLARLGVGRVPEWNAFGGVRREADCYRF
jgi:hypothetical protein